jgi:hypothetical protein
MAPRGGKLNQSQKHKKTGNGTVGWTDDTLEVSVSVLGTLRRRPAELAPSDEPTAHILVASDELLSWSREDKHRMNWRSIGPNRRSIRWPSLNKTETHQDEPFSTRWTDALVKRKHRSIRRSRSSIQRCFGHEVFSTRWTDTPSVHSVGTVVSVELQRLSDVEGTGWIDALKKHSIGSSDVTFFSDR